jgi:AraC-like DNA-binding protein
MQQPKALIEPCGNRPQDQDWGKLAIPGLWAAYGVRPPWVEGPAGACHLDALEIAVADEGCDYVRAGRHMIENTAGSYTIIPAGMEHSSRTCEVANIGLCVHLDQRAIDEARAEMAITVGSWPTVASKSTSELRAVFTTLSAEVLDTRPEVLRVDGLAQYLCGLLLGRHQPAPSHRTALTARGLDSRLGNAVELMHSSFGESVRLDELAAAAGLSKFRFAHSFKDRYGVSPYVYVQRLRLQRAAARIATSSTPLTAIALELGFGSSSRLSTAFKRSFGVSPSVWRQNQHSSRAARSV